MTDQNSEPNGSGKKPNWIKIALFVSLALNLLVVGVVAGSLIAGPHSHDRTALRGLGYTPFIRALPKEDRSALREALEREADSFRHNRSEIRTRFEALLTALRTDPFEVAEVERLFAEQTDRILDRQRLGQIALLERIAAMSHQERVAYADALDRKLKHRGRRDRKR